MSDLLTLIERVRTHKPRISARSIPVVRIIHNEVCRLNIRGPFERFRDVAADVLDGLVLREELADLINRRMLRVIRYGFDDSLGYDDNRDRDQRLCGTSWSVNPTLRMVCTFWPDRLRARSASEGKNNG